MSNCQRTTNYVKELEDEHGKSPIDSLGKIKRNISDPDTGKSEHSSKTNELIKKKTNELIEKIEECEQGYEKVRDNVGDDPREINQPFKNQKERNQQLTRLKVIFFLVLMIFLATQARLMYWNYFYEEVPLDERLEPLILSSRKKIDQARLEKASILIRFLWKLELRVFLLANEILKVWINWRT